MRDSSKFKGRTALTPPRLCYRTLYMLAASEISSMETCLEEVELSTTTNKMQINYTKTIEAIFGRLAPNPPPWLHRGPDIIQGVTQFKLLGPVVASTLFDNICSKV